MQTLFAQTPISGVLPDSTAVGDSRAHRTYVLSALFWMRDRKNLTEAFDVTPVCSDPFNSALTHGRRSSDPRKRMLAMSSITGTGKSPWAGDSAV
jgi:hypothetical protein